MRRSSASSMYIRLFAHTMKNIGECVLILTKSKIRNPKEKEIRRLEYLMAEVEHQFDTLDAFGPVLDRDKEAAKQRLQELKSRKFKK